MAPGNTDRSKKVVGLFLAAALTLTPGCSMNPFDWGRNDAPCTDENLDGYCDEDGRPVPRGGNRYSRSTYWGGRSWGGGGSGAGTGVKSGGTSSGGVSSGSKGGIGSSSRSGGGSSGG